jgi:Ca2+-binding RTX toxin-like protein
MATNELSTLEWEYLRYAYQWGVPLLGYGEGDDGGGGGGGSTDGGSTDGGGTGGSGTPDGGTGDGGPPVEIVNEQIQIGTKVLTVVVIGNQRYAVDMNDLKGVVFVQTGPGRWTPDFTFHDRGLSFTIIKVEDGSGTPDGGSDGGSGTGDGGAGGGSGAPDGGSDGGTGGGTVDGGTSSNAIRHTYVIVKMGDSGYATFAATVGTLGNDSIQRAGVVFGGSGNDGLTGSAGADILNGGSDNDWLDGGAGADLVDGGEGWDVNSHLSATSGVIIDLTTNLNGGAASGDKILNIEVLQGSNFNDRLTGIDNGNGHGVQLYGEGGHDTLTGKGGGDYLFGGTGNDTLDSGFGCDVLNGGIGADSFRFSIALGGGNVDTIQDFSVAEGDRIVLGSAVFMDVGTGPLSSAYFTLGAATSFDHHILYHQGTGDLFYDVDGSGGVAAIKFAAVSAGTALSAANFLVV